MKLTWSRIWSWIKNNPSIDLLFGALLSLPAVFWSIDFNPLNSPSILTGFYIVGFGLILVWVMCARLSRKISEARSEEFVLDFSNGAAIGLYKVSKQGAYVAGFTVLISFIAQINSYVPVSGFIWLTLVLLFGMLRSGIVYNRLYRILNY